MKITDESYLSDITIKGLIINSLWDIARGGDNLMRSFGLVTSLLIVLCGCENRVSPDQPKVNLVSIMHKDTEKEVITTEQEGSDFFSTENLRQTYFSGDIDARLALPNNRGPLGGLNAAALNTPSRGGAASEFQIAISSDDIYVEPLRSQQIIGGQWQPQTSNSRTVSLSYNNEPLVDVARDILGGILGVNYILSENIEGNVTFRSEQRFSQAELLQVLSDIMARNGYLIQYFNTVYHIGPPEELNTLTGLRRSTSLDGDQTHVIELQTSAPENIAEITAALIPPGNTVSAVPDSNRLVVYGDPNQFRSIEDLVRSLVGNGGSQNILAIFPLRRSAPETVAEQMSAVYEARNLGDAIFLPLVQRQGILVVAGDQKTVNDARRIARALDSDTRDLPKLRVIPLSYLNAQDVAAQMAEVFGISTNTQPIQPPQGDEFSSDVIRAAVDAASSGQSARGTTDNSGDSIPTPRFLRGSEDTANTSQDNSGNEISATNAQETTVIAAQVSIAADERNNALLVRSSFEDFKRISAAVAVLDVPLAQVVIEATIVEVALNDSLQYGVQLFLEQDGNLFRTSTGEAAADPGGAGFTAVLTQPFEGGTNNVQAVLTALQSVSDVKVISSPYVTVVDGATSRLTVGDQIPFVTASQTSSSDGTVTVTQEVDTRDVGVILEVTPNIAPDNSVVLDITQEVSSAAVQATNADETNPTVSTRSVQSQITVISGSTVLLGGLIQERSDISEDGVPVLRRIPVLGEAFKQRSDIQRRSELLVLITPRVIRNNTQLTQLTNQLKWELTSSYNGQ